MTLCNQVLGSTKEISLNNNPLVTTLKDIFPALMKAQQCNLQGMTKVVDAENAFAKLAEVSQTVRIDHFDALTTLDKFFPSLQRMSHLTITQNKKLRGVGSGFKSLTPCNRARPDAPDWADGDTNDSGECSGSLYFYGNGCDCNSGSDEQRHFCNAWRESTLDYCKARNCGGKSQCLQMGTPQYNCQGMCSAFFSYSNAGWVHDADNCCNV